MTEARSAEKKPSAKKRRRRAFTFKVVTWPEVVKVLSGTPWLSKLTRGIRRRGFSHFDFKSRRPVRAMVANSLTTVEDRTEARRPTKKRDAFMAAIKEVRRRLEWELWR